MVLTGLVESSGTCRVIIHSWIQEYFLFHLGAMAVNINLKLIYGMQSTFIILLRHWWFELPSFPMISLMCKLIKISVSISPPPTLAMLCRSETHTVVITEIIDGINEPYMCLIHEWNWMKRISGKNIFQSVVHNAFTASLWIAVLVLEIRDRPGIWIIQLYFNIAEQIFSVLDS